MLNLNKIFNSNKKNNIITNFLLSWNESQIFSRFETFGLKDSKLWQTFEIGN